MRHAIRSRGAPGSSNPCIDDAHRTSGIHAHLVSDTPGRAEG